MLILEHSTYDGDSIARNLGASEYSYWFVRRAFRPILERFGIVIPVADPTHEIDRIYHAAKSRNYPCVFFSFNPPHRTVVGLDCPTIPVFAWEYDTLPNETWEGDPRNDWVTVLSQMPAAITHSRFSAEVVRKSLGADYPVWSIPAPIGTGHILPPAPLKSQDTFSFELEGGVAIDTGNIDLSMFLNAAATGQGARALRLLEMTTTRLGHSQTLTLTGVVYTAVFNPVDGRKNWLDLLAGFIVAFRDNPNATLVVKTTHRDIGESALPVLAALAEYGRFRCRVIVVHGLLSDIAYRKLLDATSFAVNTSHGEGQCLPLMEYMAAGRPAVTPLHTAMLDYVSDDNSFVVESHQRPAFWPHDARQAIRCLRNEISFADLVRRYRESFLVSQHEPERYEKMGQAAAKALDAFCSETVATARIAEVMRHLGLANFVVPFTSNQPSRRAV